MDKNMRIATDVLQAVGGAENVTFVTNCITRLRFNLKDQSIPNDEAVKAIDGVIGIAKSAGQYHVIIGQNVPKVFSHLLTLGNLNADTGICTPKEKQPMSIKGVFSNILNVLAGSVTPLIPIMLGAAMVKMLVVVLGPDMLNMMSDESDLYTLFSFVGDAGFYYMPVYVGYTSAKKMGANSMIGMLLGAVLVHPTVIGLAESAVSFTVFGIPTTVQNYSSTLLPIVLSVWMLTYVEKILNKVIPDLLKTVFEPFLSILIMLPIMFCICGPIGGILGNGLSDLLLGLGDVPVIGIFAVALIGGLWEFLVITGMHQVLIASMFVIFMKSGYEGVVLPGAIIASIAVSGMLFGAFFRIKNDDERALTLGYLIAAFIGGITEPGLYGNAMKFGKPFIGLFIGGFVGGLYASIVGAKCYALVPVASFLGVTSFTGGPSGNFLQGVIACSIAFIVAAVVTYFFGFKKDEPVLVKDH